MRRKPETRFAALTAEETGIDFVHEWNPPPELEDRLNSYAIGVGVAIGDYDADGLPDVFLACQTKGGRLYRNLGDFRFRDVTANCGIADSLDGMWATGCGFADIDGNGHLDLFVCGYDTPTRLFMSQGDGTFEEQAAVRGLGFHGAGVMLAFADYDRDGDLDCYLLTNHLKPDADAEFQVAWRGNKPAVPEPFREFRDIIIPPPGEGAPKLIEAAQYDRLYRNDGHGYFSDVTRSSGIGRKNYHGLSATWWDCNSDRFPDLYVANDFFGPDQLLVNNGDGTFTDAVEQQLPHVPWFSMGADISDINNDGLFDLIATDMSSTSLHRSQLTMGQLDSEAWFLDYAQPKQYMRNALFLNSGCGRFMEIAALSGVDSTDWTWAVKFADLDGDGWQDLFVTNGMSRDFQNSDLKNQSRVFSKSHPGKPTHAFWLQQEKLCEKNLVFRNTRDLRFAESGKPWGLDHRGVSLGAAYGDLDNDGDVDIVVNGFQEPALVYRNDTTEANFVTVHLWSSQGNRFGVGSKIEIATGDLRQSRYLTLARGFMSTDEPAAHFGVGSADRVEELVVTWPDGQRQRFEDLPVNHRYTIEKATNGSSNDKQTEPEILRSRFQRADAADPIVHKERPFDDYDVQPLLPFKQSIKGPGMALGDVDHDGWQDLYVSGAAGRNGQLFLGSSRGFLKSRLLADHLEAQDGPNPQAEELGVVFLDADSDGDLDLFIAAGGVESEPGSAAYRNTLWINDGSGSFLPAADGVLPTNHASSHCVASADWDRDGDLDLFVGGGGVPGRYPLASESQLLVNDAGRFVDAEEGVFASLGDLGIVTSALWSDFDSDGWIDLLVAEEWGPVRAFKNRHGKLIEYTDQAEIESLLGMWNGIAGRDIDNDGDIDYVVTNLGQNSRYRAHDDATVLLFRGDFDESGKKHLLEAVVQDGRSMPLRGKLSLENAMPFALASSETYREFADASLEDLFGARQLEEAKRFEANCLSSVVLINDGSGKFRCAELPRLAQVAPGCGVALTDVDSDGKCDLLMAHNSFAPQRQTGRLDGGLGLYLRGEGDGTFTPVWPRESGIVMHQDATCLVVGDLDHQAGPDFVAGVNDGTSQVHLNAESGAGEPVVVRLRGPGGNPTGVGALVQIRTNSGEVQSAEIAAGGGYLSQSSGEVFFGCPTGDEITRVEVRWPDGTTQSSSPDLGQRVIELDYRS